MILKERAVTHFNTKRPLQFELTEEESGQIANTLRFLSIEAVQKANSGHPGAPMGLADVATAIWSQGLKFDPANPNWSRRDRFVLSCGHASMLLYSLLYLWGEGLLKKSDLASFRQLGSLTPGHPERGHTAGVEMTTGPLGQGCATSVGMAVAASRLDRMIVKAGGGLNHPWADQKTVVICSDGDLMEGVSYEAASLAGHWGLKDLIWFYDHNKISIDGATSLSFTENVGSRFISMGWRVIKVDGHDSQALAKVVEQAWDSDDKPTIVICKTHIGFGSPNKVDSSSSHGSPLGNTEIELTRKALGWTETPFTVPKKVNALMKKIRAQRTENVEAWHAYKDEWAESHPQAAEVAHMLLTEETLSFEQVLEAMLNVTPLAGATRKLSNQALIEALKLFPKMMGGSADLSGSNGLSFTETSFGSPLVNSKLSAHGRILHFGVREHAMASITNGLTVHGSARGFNGTFLVFSDYLRPALRLAALSKIPSAFVLTHDSIFLGEDGPTHQPVEHAWALRLIPDVLDFRPADGIEVAASWALALTDKERPSVMMLTRQNLPKLERSEDFDPIVIAQGAYVLAHLEKASMSAEDLSVDGEQISDEPITQSSVTLVGTGSEVSLCVEVAQALFEKGYTVRVVSMPSVKLFMAQPVERRKEILGEGLMVTIEAGITLPWGGVVGANAIHIGVDTFGASAPMADLAEFYGLNTPQILKQILARLETY
jgi:transketolase